MPKGQIDILVAQKAIAEVDAGIAKIDKMNESILALSKSVRELNTNLSSVKTPKGLETRLKKNANAQLKVKDSVEEVRLAEIKLQQDRETQINKESALREKLMAQKKREEAQDKRNRIALDKQRQATEKMSGAYSKLNRAYEKAKLNLANLLAVENKNTVAIKKAQAEFDRLGSKVRKVDAATRNYTKTIGNYGSALKGARGLVRQLTSAMGLMGGAFLAIRIIRDTANRIREFDKSIVGLSAILRTNRKDLKDLEQAIIDVAGSSIKTSNEVADLATVLATLGKSKREIIELLKPVNDLSVGLKATSGEAGELLVGMLNAFGKGNEEASKFADIIAKIRTSTALDFERIKNSFGFLAPTSKAVGVSLEKMGAIVGVLKDNYIKASRAGRLMSTSFLRLAKRGLTLEDALDKINEAQNKNVTGIKLLKVAGDLFGARSAALGLILANNRDKVADLTKAFEDSKGSLDELVKAQLESLDAKLRILDATWEKFIITVESGEGSFGTAIKGMIVSLTSLINTFTDINEVTTIIGKRQKTLLDFAGLGWLQSTKRIKEARQELEQYDEELETLSLHSDEAIQRQITWLQTSIDFVKENAKQGRNGELVLNQTKRDGIELAAFQIKRLKELLDGRKEEREEIEKNTDATKKNNDAKEDTNKILKGSIESLEKIISANNKIIKQTNDTSFRRQKQQENIALKKQIELLTKIPGLVTKIKSASKVGIITQEKLGKRKKAGTREGTALAGGTKPETGDFIEGLEIPTPFDVSGVSGFENAINEVTDFVDTYGEQLGQATDITNAFFDNRIARIDEDIRKNNEYFDSQIEAAEGNKEEQERLEEERKVKNEKLLKKRREEQNKQAIINKAMSIAQTTINTSQAIVAALAPPPLGLGPVAGIPLAIATGVLGAAQIALIASTPIPKFKEGKEKDGYKGLGVVGDGGVSEYIESDKGIIKTPSSDTLFKFKGNETVHKDLESLAMSKGYDFEAINRAAVMTSILNDGERLSSVQLADVFSDSLNNFNSNIETKIERGIKRGFKHAKINNETIVNIENSKYNETL